SLLPPSGSRETPPVRAGRVPPALVSVATAARRGRFLAGEKLGCERALVPGQGGLFYRRPVQAPARPGRTIARAGCLRMRISRHFDSGLSGITPLMGWFGRAPARPARKLARVSERGARHARDREDHGRRSRHRYRKVRLPHRWPEPARRHRPAAEVVARPGRITISQYATVSDRHGGVRRRSSP